MADEGPDYDDISAKLRERRKHGAAIAAANVGKPAKPRAPIWPVLVALVVIGVGGWLLSQKLREASRIQDCVMQGRKNCDHIDDPNER
ncbi:MAG TPA: hypothetical protein VGM56_06725 [Byssovorax sp.]|jgi:hypothetical protein